MTILDKRHQIQDFTSEILIFIKRIILNFPVEKKNIFRLYFLRYYCKVK